MMLCIYVIMYNIYIYIIHKAKNSLQQKIAPRGRIASPRRVISHIGPNRRQTISTQVPAGAPDLAFLGRLGKKIVFFLPLEALDRNKVIEMLETEQQETLRLCNGKPIQLLKAFPKQPKDRRNPQVTQSDNSS